MNDFSFTKSLSDSYFLSH